MNCSLFLHIHILIQVHILILIHTLIHTHTHILILIHTHIHTPIEINKEVCYNIISDTGGIKIWQKKKLTLEMN